MPTIEELQAENQRLRDDLQACENTIVARDATIVTRDATIADLRETNRLKDIRITGLITSHHREKMLLLNGVETRLNQLLQLHQQLARQLRRCENRVTTAPAQEDIVHGFAMTLWLLREERAHEIRFIADQESYVSRQVTNANALLFNFTETGNPIDLRQNLQRVANERLQARIADYLAVNPKLRKS
ncbi:hypothetical protein PHYSODRAFT_334809 [Phytophthora sojae]|uniref:Uncharacterized protein n=1 Tax=Phytophthora sojae (strain P6497) TaxID=1094619 RepID=G4ZS84_PHYSP|nr:hypothetical protein PHYSODRAFT_334809 [Phytophthora sojae]EGZ12980.1 hypothetical protein PHYSODRAFT_334809 [Phytophthora sojae]|eukprot:XP_009530409.1 hypothetical protein PHYSODRAFT_334809 [Phytophthora sojae]